MLRRQSLRRAATLVRRRWLSTAAEAPDRFSIVGTSREGRAIYLDSQVSVLRP